MPDSGFRIDCKSFFDRPAVINAVKPKRRSALSKLGAFIRRRARTLTGRSSKNSAQPGQPPKMHARQLHDLIEFAYDPAADNVVVGPEKFNQAKDVQISANDGGSNVPSLMESGGTEVIARRGRKPRTARYRGNPFMQPSLSEAMTNEKLKAAWSDSAAEL